MARIRSKKTTVTYAGRLLFDGSRSDQSLAQLYTMTRAYSTTPEPILDAANPWLREYGNASGNFPFSIITEYGGEDAAFESMLELAAFFDDHPTGLLTVAVGEASCSWEAGVDSLEIVPEMPAQSIRLTLNAAFLLGAKKSA